MNYKLKITNLLDNQKGQSMLEFALILPLLIILTLGGVFFIMSFTHKATMNGVAFMATRAAAVRNDPKQIAEWVKQKYVEKSNRKWLNQVDIKTKSDKESISVTFSKQGETLEILANAINVISGDGHYEPKKIVTTMTLPYEYFTTEDGGSRPKTTATVDYHYQLTYDYLEHIVSAVINTTQMADKKNMENQDIILGLDPPNKNITDFYNKWGMKYDSDSLYPELTDKGSLQTMKTLSENFKLLEAASDIVGAIDSYFGGFAKEILGTIGQYIGAGFEKAMSGISEVADKHVRQSYKKAPSPVVK